VRSAGSLSRSGQPGNAVEQLCLPRYPIPGPCRQARDLTRHGAKPMPQTIIPSREAIADTDGPAPAATFSAGMVRRGHNPWWGKDQKPAPARTSGEAEAQLSAPALISGRDRVMGARTLLDRDTPPPVPTERRSRLRAMTPPQADSGAGLFEHLPVEMLKDVAIFIAVFTVSCALMLTLSVYAF